MNHRNSARIEDYAFIGDLHTGALVHRDGSIDWLCLPRFDSNACLAALLGDRSHGHWRLAPEGAGLPARRRYRGETLILETEWETAEGAVRVLDFMPPREESPDVIRIVEGISGRVPMSMELRLRFDFGRGRPWIVDEGQNVVAVSGPDAVRLHTDQEVTRADHALVSSFTVSAGERVGFVLNHQASYLDPPPPTDPERALSATEDFWADWIGQCEYDGRWAEEVRRSLILLKALTYAPTGGIVAAATSSLPEALGAGRNWDYRFSWLRDATFALQALVGTGYVDEARAWREWLIRAAAGEPEHLQIMYRIDGDRWMAEHTLDWLPGFAGSQPVRAGNKAAGQRQLDVWGEVLVGLHLGREAGLHVTETSWELQRGLLDWLEQHWSEPDNGLWEMRGDRQHFVHSKVMAWAGFDRAVRAVESHGLDGPVDRWRSLAKEIHDDVCRNGFDTDRGTFVQHYATKEVDAALLLLPRVGFLPWDDERIRGTVAAVEQDLTVDGFVRRYRTDEGSNADGLEGEEATFIACSYWMVDALLATGRRDEAERLFERLLDVRNDVGMLSEEYDAIAGRQLGNTPQAFSLVGLVNSATHLSSEHHTGHVEVP